MKYWKMRVGLDWCCFVVVGIVVAIVIEIGSMPGQQLLGQQPGHFDSNSPVNSSAFESSFVDVLDQDRGR